MLPPIPDPSDALVLEVDPENCSASQPGVVNDDFGRNARHRLLWYPPDLASAPGPRLQRNVSQ
jgi:hypothetical protein